MQLQNEKVKILGGGAMLAKLRRMAYEVYEKNIAEEGLVMVAIGQKGLAMAQLLSGIIAEISPINVDLLPISKSEDGNSTSFDAEDAASRIQGKTVLMVDDVLYSGQTLFRAVAATMQHAPAKVQVAILIDRGHRTVPIAHDFVGMVLATSLRQYVSVEFDEDQSKASVFLY